MNISTKLLHAPISKNTKLPMAFKTHSGVGKLSHCRTKVRQRHQIVRQEVLKKMGIVESLNYTIRFRAGLGKT